MAKFDCLYVLKQKRGTEVMEPCFSDIFPPWKSITVSRRRKELAANIGIHVRYVYGYIHLLRVFKLFLNLSPPLPFIHKSALGKMRLQVSNFYL